MYLVASMGGFVCLGARLVNCSKRQLPSTHEMLGENLCKKAMQMDTIIIMLLHPLEGSMTFIAQEPSRAPRGLRPRGVRQGSRAIN